MGCCQVSANDPTCASWEYLNGKCITLTTRNIGCSRQHWRGDRQYNPETNKCEDPAAAGPATVFEASFSSAAVSVKGKVDTGKYCGGSWVGLKPRPLDACAALTLNTPDCAGGGGLFIWKGDYTPWDQSCRCCKSTGELKDHDKWDAYDATEVLSAVEEEVTGGFEPVFEAA